MICITLVSQELSNRKDMSMIGKTIIYNLDDYSVRMKNKQTPIHMQCFKEILSFLYVTFLISDAVLVIFLGRVST